MGVAGLYAYLNNRASGCAEHCTVRTRRRQIDTAARDANVASTDSHPPQRIVLLDGNGLYHHILYRYCASAPRSLGGEWAPFAAATRRFLAPFIAADCALVVVWDGCASAREGKAATRVQRARDRRAKMKRFDTEMRARMAEEGEDGTLPANCAVVEPNCEAVLPAPAGSLLCFMQVVQSMGVPCWTSDGENDEHIGALAVFLASQQQSDSTTGTDPALPSSTSAPASVPPPVYVDIVGQDSDFLVLDTRVPGLDMDDAVGYVPLDTLKFTHTGGDGDDSDDEEEEVQVSISFRRFSTRSICAGLRLPTCLLPSLACLIGNDSRLDLLHFHCFTHSGAFTRMVREAPPAQHGGGGGGGGNKVASRNNSAAAASSSDSNGGYSTATQLVEAVLTFLQVSHRSATVASAAAFAARTQAAKNPYAPTGAQLDQRAQEAMLGVAQRIFGDAQAATRPVPRPPPHASPSPPPPPPPPTPPPHARVVREGEGDQARPLLMSSTSATHEDSASALQHFRAAQLKYSLARFFQSPPTSTSTRGNDDGSTAGSGWGIFDPGFRIHTDYAATAATAAPASESAAVTVDAAADDDLAVVSHSTSVLLPLPLLHLYRSSLFSPILLNILLERRWEHQVILGDVVHPCVAHTVGVKGGAARSRGAAAATSGTAAASSSACRSAADCGVGVRTRIYQLMFFGMDLAPRATSSSSSSSSSAAAASSSPSSVARRTIWELVPRVAHCNREEEEDDDTAAITEHIHWVPIEVRWDDETLAIVEKFAEEQGRAHPHGRLPPLFHIRSGADGTGAQQPQHPRTESEWAHLCYILDVVPDLIPPSSKSAPNKPPHSPLPLRLLALRSCLATLSASSSSASSSSSSSSPPLSLGPLALVLRQVFLHSLRPLMLLPVGGPIDPDVVRDQVQRGIIGLNAMGIMCALSAAQENDEEEEEDEVESSDPPLFSLEALSLSQLFLECYHWTEYALQVVRCHSHMAPHAAASTSAHDASSSSSSSSASSSQSSPLLALEFAYKGSVLHTTYVRLMQMATTATKSSGGGAAVQKARQQQLLQQQLQQQKMRKQSAATSAPRSAPSAQQSAVAAAGPPTSLFSASLSTALHDLDAVVHQHALTLLAQLAPSSPSRRRRHGRAEAIFIALKTFVYSSVGLSAPAVAATSSPAASPAAAAMQHTAKRTPLTPQAHVLPRPQLPYEGRGAECAGSLLRPAASSLGASHFSLCCAADSVAGPSSCECALRAIDVLAPSAAAAGSVVSEDSESEGAFEVVGTGKNKKKRGRTARGKKAK